MCNYSEIKMYWSSKPKSYRNYGYQNKSKRRHRFFPFCQGTEMGTFVIPDFSKKDTRFEKSKEKELYENDIFLVNIILY